MLWIWNSQIGQLWWCHNDMDPQLSCDELVGPMRERDIACHWLFVVPIFLKCFLCVRCPHLMLHPFLKNFLIKCSKRCTQFELIYRFSLCMCVIILHPQERMHEFRSKACRLMSNWEGFHMVKIIGSLSCHSHWKWGGWCGSITPLFGLRFFISALQLCTLWATPH